MTNIYIGDNPPHDGYDVVNPVDLSVYDNGEVDSITAPSILDFVKYELHKDYISSIVAKLKHGGKIIIGGTDVITLSLVLFNKTTSIEELNRHLFDSPKYGLTCLENVRKIFIQLGMKITRMVPGTGFIVEGERP